MVRFEAARLQISMSRHDSDDSMSRPADTASARWVGYKLVGGGNQYDLLERAGVRAIQCASAGSSHMIPNT